MTFTKAHYKVNILWRVFTKWWYRGLLPLCSYSLSKVKVKVKWKNIDWGCLITGRCRGEYLELRARK